MSKVMNRYTHRFLLALILMVGLQSQGPARAGAPPYEADYQQARNTFYRFRDDEEKKKFRHNWQNLAEKFVKIAEKYPDSPRAPDALFTAGRLYHDLYLISRVADDLDSSITFFRRLVNKFPQNHLADDAQLFVALKWVEFDKSPEDARKELRYLVEQFPEGDATPKARLMLEDLGGLPAEDEKKPEKKTEKKPKDKPKKKEVAKKPGRPVLEKIRHWSNPGYTRIALYTRTRAGYKVGKLAADKKRNLPHRLYIDVLEAKAGSDLPASIAVEDSVVRNIRYAEREGGFIRVVVDLDKDRQHRVFPMDDPARVVLDITASEDTVAKVIGKKLQKKKKKSPKKKVKELKAKSKPGESLSMLVGLKVKRIVIDPGHGGRDPGAIGPKGTLEKDMVLDVARRLKKLLDKKLNLEVLLTRNSDRSMALEARTAFANKREADLFVSIHFNAHRNRKFRGVETFYLDLTNDRYSIKLAARENATSEKAISDLKYILADLALKSHVDDSILLSRLIQKAMVGKLRRKHKAVRDLGVKPALFYVLIGARMPSILIEGSFITNPMEEKRIRTKSYRQRLAEGIFTGIKNFINEREKLLKP
jgi:N-acetylmuramoyl-L-alanine amidase